MAGNNEENNQMCFKYHSDHNTNDRENMIERPRLEIVMKKNLDIVGASTPPEFRTFGLVDSGADISFIPRSVADILGLDLDSAQIRTTQSASGEFKTYRTTMHLEIIHENQRIKVGMVDVAVPQEDIMMTDLEKYILIGRSGLFDKYKVTFDESNKTISLS